MSEERPPEPDFAKKEGWRRSAPVLGCCAGGCLIPFLLFLFCVFVLRDVGGPLFWPIIAVPMAIVGFLIGIAIRAYGKAKED